MTRSTKKWLWLGCIFMFLALPLIYVAEPAGQNQTKVARMWAANLSASEITAAVTRIQDYPVAYRHALVSVLPAASKVALWRGHITHFIDSRPSMSLSQRQLLESIMALLTEQAYVIRDVAVRMRIRALSDDARSFLSDDEIRYLLFDLGPQDVGRKTIEPFQHKLARVVRSVFVLHAFRVPHCDCSFGDPYETDCPDNYKCYQGSSTVYCPNPVQLVICSDELNVDCGLLGLDPCDGLCKPESEEEESCGIPQPATSR